MESEYKKLKDKEPKKDPEKEKEELLKKVEKGDKEEKEPNEKEGSEDKKSKKSEDPETECDPEKEDCKKDESINKQKGTSMKLILEDSFETEYITEINESTGEKNYIIKGVVSTPDKKNRNGRIYPKNIWEKEVQRYINEDIKNNTYNTLSEWEHPSRTSVDPMKAVAKCRKVWWNGNEVMGEFVILNNNSPETSQIKALIDAGLPIGVSTRGVGKLDRNNIVEEYKWITTDLVANPSNHASYLKGLRESGFNEEMILENKEFNITETGDIICDENGCKIQEPNEADQVIEVFKEYIYKEPVLTEYQKLAQELFNKSKLDESPVGQVGRTGYKDAEDYIARTSIKKQIRELLKKVGGKTVLLKLLDTMNAQPQNEKITEASDSDIVKFINTIEKIQQVCKSKKMEAALDEVLDLMDTEC